MTFEVITYVKLNRAEYSTISLSVDTESAAQTLLTSVVENTKLLTSAVYPNVTGFFQINPAYGFGLGELESDIVPEALNAVTWSERQYARVMLADSPDEHTLTIIGSVSLYCTSNTYFN